MDRVVDGNTNSLVHSMETLIGNTPLLAIDKVCSDRMPVRVLAKAEWYNPGGSVKDRAAMAMVLDGERRGLMNDKKILVDATSGNTGIAYAMICAQRGYRCQLALPKNASIERKQSLLAYGAELIQTDPTEGTDGAQRYVKSLVSEDPDRYFYPDQYNNDCNWKAHYETTAMEIWRQTEGKITHFVAGLGTSGTFVGTSRRLKELNPNIQCISMQPDSPLHGLEGMKHMATALVPGIYDKSIADWTVEVDTDEAHHLCLRLAREEGLLVGVSSGGNLAAARKVAATILQQGLKDGVIVTIFCDSASKYLSESFWSEAQDQAENWP